MYVNCGWITEAMERLAPRELALDWDNAGFLVGSSGAEVRKALIALDLTDAVLDEAISAGADIIITHHPLIFKPIKSVTGDTPVGRRVMGLIKHDIAHFAAHTNFDIVGGGTNDALFERLELTEKRPLMPPDENGCSLGRVGDLGQALSFGEFLGRVRDALGLDHLRFCGDRAASVRRIGLCTGACAGQEFLRAAANNGCDVYITGDVSFHGAQAACDLGLKLIDATHYATEAIALERIKSHLGMCAAESGAELEITVSKSDGQVLRNF